ncbi:MAG: hypothetical protein Q7J64_00390 [Elusimicrobiota bacterium]|nr:hypothetical protein [Elusimicrobiota bacterium]
MKIALAVLVFLGAAAMPAAAVEGKIIDNPDLSFIVGYRMWLNNWSSWNTGESGTNFIQNSQASLANSGSLTFRYKRFFTNVGLTGFGEIVFPTYSDRLASGALRNVQMKATRNEVDWNLGYSVIPQLGFTVGLKHVAQKWQYSYNGAAYGSATNWYWTGPTLGMYGSAAIGSGFSIYGNGAGGIMSVSQDPKPTVARNDTATYESAELGLAWKAAKAPLSASLGYKFQRINTRFDVAGYTNMRGLDLTSGYTLGLNVIF